MADLEDPNKAVPSGKPLQDVGSSNYGGSGDRVQLIDDDQEYMAAETEIPANVNGTGQRTEISPLQVDDTSGLQSKKKTQEGLKVVVVSSVSFAVSVTVALILTIILGPPAIPPHGAVSCDSEVCSKIGRDVLENQGSGVDAAIATALCMGVVNPHHSGIGGGLFMVVRQHKENTSTVINARETAPAASDESLYTDLELARLGELAVGVPGTLKGLQYAHDKFGRLKWKDLVSPAADLARKGFEVSANLAYAIETAIDPALALDERLVELFYKNNKPLKEGDTLKLPQLAAVLDDIGENGIDSFYAGSYASDIMDVTNNAVTVDDMANYDVSEVETLQKIFRNMTIETMPAPGGGPLMLFIMHVIQNYTLAKENQTDPLYYHRLIEATKFMYGERFRFGDPLFNNEVYNNTDLVTSLEYAASIRSQITDDATHQADYYLQGAMATPDGGTCHVSVIAPGEEMVALTSSVNHYFGSHLVTKSGIILNDVMSDFDIPITPGEPVNKYNRMAAGKQPLSSMSPTVVHRLAKPCASRVAIGGINGTQIIPAVAQVLINILGFGKNITQAIQAKRLTNPLVPDQLEYDTGFNATILSALSQLGHTDQVEDPRGVSYVHAVAKINETVMAHADGREGGSGDAQF